MSVISVRVDKRTKEVLKKAGVNVSNEVRDFLHELAWKAELKQRVTKLNGRLEKMTPAEKGFASRSVREDRERD